MAYLRNPDGNIEERNVTIEQFYNLRRQGWKRLNGQDRLAVTRMLREKAELHKKSAKDGGALDVHFISSNNFAYDGYSASAALFKRYIGKFGVFLNDDFEGQEICLTYHLPNTAQRSQSKKNVIFSMFETTRYPEFWGAHWKKADVPVVPCQFCAEVMQNQWGIIPEILQLGYDEEKFYLLERKRNAQSPFTFLHFDAFKWRKGWDLVLTAYDAEFNENDNVRLIFKTTIANPTPLSDYRNLEIIKGIYTLDELRDLMARSDCFVFPSRGEGFGLTPLEAMATGMPIIVPNHSGMSEYFDAELMQPLEWNYIVPKYDNKEFDGLDLGVQFQPTVESVRKAMRAEYEMWKLGQEIRDARAKLLVKHAKKFTIKRSAKQLAEILLKLDKQK